MGDIDEMVEAVEAELAKGFTYQVINLLWRDYIRFPTKAEALQYIKEELESDPASNKHDFKLYECREIYL